MKGVNGYVQLSLQLIARVLCQSFDRGECERALIISTEPTETLVRMLRDAVVTQIYAGGREKSSRLAKEILGLVSIVRVFDITGVSEVLSELDTESSEAAPDLARKGDGGEMGSPRGRDEIPDSDEELTPSPSPPATEPTPKAREELPGVILITHFSTLLTTLYTHAEQTAVHNTLHLLSSRLRYLSRTLPSSPLIMLTNTTTPSTFDPISARRSGPPSEPTPQAPDPSLRSIFSASGPYATTWQKPSFGLVFAQFLDLHLLCTRIARTRGDAEGIVAGRGQGRQVWVVEALLDEGGVWEGDRGPRRGRERRWGVVDVLEGRIVDAFDAGSKA